jgi:hypothetical protein
VWSFLGLSSPFFLFSGFLARFFPLFVYLFKEDKEQCPLSKTRFWAGNGQAQKVRRTVLDMGLTPFVDTILHTYALPRKSREHVVWNSSKK